MSVADMLQFEPVVSAFEGGRRISAEQCEGLATTEFVPKMLELDGGPPISPCPEQCDHFTESPQRVSGGVDTSHHSANGVHERTAIRQAVFHELRQHFIGIQGHELALP